MAARIDEKTQFVDSGGSPLLNGKIYIGTVNTDPTVEANQISIFSDRELTITIANPQTLDSLGRSTNKIWIPGKYSLTVQDEDAVNHVVDLDSGETEESGITSISNIQGTNTITGEASTTITAYVDKEMYTFTVANENTGAVTVNFDGVGARTIKKNFSEDIESGQFKANQIVTVQHNSTPVTPIMEWVNHNDKVVFQSASSSIAAATTVDLSAATGNQVSITGSTTIASFGATPAGTIYNLTFTGTPTITFNATSMLIPGQASITIVAGDQVKVESLGSGNNQIQVFRFSGKALVSDDIATQAQMETATDITTIVTPGRTQNHPGVSKAWVDFDSTGTLTIQVSHNVSSVTDSGVGLFIVNFTTAFSTAEYVGIGMGNRNFSTTRANVGGNTAATTTTFAIWVEAAGTAVDADRVYMAFFGDQ